MLSDFKQDKSNKTVISWLSKYTYMNYYSRPFIAQHFVDLESVKLSKCGTIGSVWDILI